MVTGFFRGYYDSTEPPPMSTESDGVPPFKAAAWPHAYIN